MADVAAAVLNARDAADVIRRFEDRVDIAVIDLADDRAFALLDLARDAAAGMGVRQVVDPDLTGDEAVRDRAVVNAYQTADVLLAVDLAVEQGDVLDEGRVVLVADVAEQADVLLGIVDLQVLDRVELAVKGAEIALVLLGRDRLEALNAGHVDIGRQHEVGRAVGRVLPRAREVNKLLRGRNFVAAGRLVIGRRCTLGLVAGR